MGDRYTPNKAERLSKSFGQATPTRLKEQNPHFDQLTDHLRGLKSNLSLRRRTSFLQARF
jgi:thymidylate synthase